MRHSGRRTILIPLLAIVGGCYVSVPTDPVSIPPGGDLTISLSPEGMARLNQTSTRGGDAVTGQLVSVTGDSLTIAARLGGPAYAGAAGLSGLRQTLSFARADIERVTVGELHRGRTAAVVAAIVAVGTFAILTIFNPSGDPPGTTTPPPPPPSPLRPGG
jgi:hypothetical protein